VLKTTWNALIDSKHLQLGAWEKNVALFDDSVGGSPHKILGFHIFSLAKLPYKYTLMRSCASFPNPPRFVFVN
jgi:hypothetical protein